MRPGRRLDPLLKTLRRSPVLYSGLRSTYRLLRSTRRNAAWSLVVLRYRFASSARQARGRDAPLDSAGGDAVVFSSYVPTDEALSIAHEFLDVLKEGFSDCDFFVGINPGSLPEWELALRESGLRVRIGKVDPRLAVDSDVSGFQRALQLMRDEKRDYHLVWFGHTKGATADNPAVRRYLIENFCLERRRITNLFEHPRVGSFGNDVTVDVSLSEIDPLMNRLFPFPYEGIGTFYLHTFYVLRGSIVRSFLDGCSEDFFTQNLVRDLGFDRYFFERDFSRLADRFGYYPLYRVRHQHMSTVPVTRRVVRLLYREWEQQLPTSMRATIHLS